MSDQLPVKIQVSDIFGLGKIANSPAVHRLVDGVINGVGGLYRDVFDSTIIKRRTRAEVDAAIDAATRLPQQEDLLLDVSGRAAVRLKRQSALNQINRENVAIEAIRIALDEYGTEELASETALEIDSFWQENFWSVAETAVDDQLQSMWARVLARKALVPNEISVRVLNRMQQLSHSEIAQVLSLAPFSVRFQSPIRTHADQYGIVLKLGQYQGTFSVKEHENKALNDYVFSKVSSIDRVGLDSAGLMQSVNGWASEYSLPYNSKLEVVIGNEEFTLLDLPPPNDRYAKIYHVGSGFGLTREGWEVCRVANIAPDQSYLALLESALASSGARLVRKGR